MFAEHMKRGPWEDSPFASNFVHHPHRHHHHHHHPSDLLGPGTCSAESQQQQQHFIPIQVMAENYNNNNNNNRASKQHSFPLMEEEMTEPEFEIKEINKIEIPTIFRQNDEERRPTVRSTPHPVPPPMMSERGGGGQGIPNNNNNFMDSHINMSTSPLGSPGFNSSIRHIPIFFEGKPQPHNPTPSAQQQHQNNAKNNNSSSPPQQQQQPQQIPVIQQQQQQQKEVIPTPIPLPPAPSARVEESNQKSGPPTPPPRNPHNIHHHHHQNHNFSVPTPPPPPQSSSTTSIPQQEEVKAPQRKNPASSEKDDSPVPPPIKRPTPPKSPLEKVHLIGKDVTELEVKVGEFNGVGKTKEYLFLDEMLTRNLIRLDDICVDGREDIRMARKDCITRIQKCISILESKTSGGNNNTNKNDDSMAVALITPAPLVLPSNSSQIVKQGKGSPKSIIVPVHHISPTHRSEVNLEVKGEESEN